ncbi:MAG TPA: long-chain fatty acid--CoA ligase, partial [Candidatus Deferrimicrobium sp.]|nr:long-chain fatty acid--CoA ligase [Candidatus Deferrimicrobium sp.]
WDGKVFGDLLVRGPWITSSYFKGEGGDPLRDGWFPTGDVATIDPDGYMQITDRSKDVIKTGGEWISTIDLENIAVGHPAVAEAAVIGVLSEKWNERPMACVVLKPEFVGKVEEKEILHFLATRVAKWWIPDEVMFVDTIPKTSVGKFAKRFLRDRFKEKRFA